MTEDDSQDERLPPAVQAALDQMLARHGRRRRSEVRVIRPEDLPDVSDYWTTIAEVRCGAPGRGGVCGRNLGSLVWQTGDPDQTPFVLERQVTADGQPRHGYDDDMLDAGKWQLVEWRDPFRWRTLPIVLRCSRHGRRELDPTRVFAHLNSDHRHGNLYC